MNSLKKVKETKEKKTRAIAFEGGSYSLMMTALVLAVLIALNVLVAYLPANLTKLDISSSKLYSVTSNTKAVLSNLNKDVTIYWVTQAGEEDEIIGNLLSKYTSLSDKIEVVKKNPDIYPKFAQMYTSEEVMNNSLIVECEDKSRFIGIDDIYLQEADMANYSYNTSFDGEGAITSAIDYVVSDNQPIIYLLQGHGEAELPENFKDQVEKANMEIKPFSLLNSDEVPEDAACLMIFSPETDISEEEKDMLISYAENGGKMLVMAGPPVEGSLTNLNSVLENYGITTVEGIAVESERSNYAFRSPYIIMAEMGCHPILDPLVEEKYYPIVPIANGMIIEDEPSDCVVTELLRTSDTAFSKLDGYNLATYDKEEGDTDGPFSLAVNIECAGGGQIVWFSTSNLLDDMYNAYSSGANIDLTLNSLSSMIGESEAVAIRSKSLNYNYLTISESTASLLRILMIGVFPVIYLAVGIFVVLRRKEKQKGETL